MPTTKRLITLGDCRRYLAALILKHDKGQVPDGIAKTQGYLINILKSCIESSEIESRLAALEEKAGLK